MSCPSFHEFRAAATAGERLTIAHRSTGPSVRATTGTFAGTLVRLLDKAPRLGRLHTVAERADRRRAENSLAWHTFAAALADQFGATAAALALDGLAPDRAEDLTGRDVRLAHLYVIADPTARRHYCATGPVLSRPGSPRRFRETGPALARKNGCPGVNLNNAVRFEGSKALISCRHLAVAWELEFLSNAGKVPYARFLTARAIQQSVPPGADNAAIARRFPASVSKAIVRHADWGREITAHFRDMEKKGESLRTVYVMSCSDLMTHGMALGFKIRADAHTPDARAYVVNFYDPNNTATHVRAAMIDDPARFEPLTAVDLFRQGSIDPAHYYDYPVSWFFHTSAEPTQAARFPDEFLVPYAMWDALRMNQSTAIAECRPRFEQLSRSRRAGLLAAIVDGTPGLHWALQQGHAEAVAAWGELLLASGLAADAQAELLAARRDTGEPGIRFAKAPAIAAWENIVARAGLSVAARQALYAG